MAKVKVDRFSEETSFTLECSNCKSVTEFEQSDISVHTNLQNFRVRCPMCEREWNIHPSKVNVRTIKNAEKFIAANPKLESFWVKPALLIDKPVDELKDIIKQLGELRKKILTDRTLTNGILTKLIKLYAEEELTENELIRSLENLAEVKGQGIIKEELY